MNTELKKFESIDGNILYLKQIDEKSIYVSLNKKDIIIASLEENGYFRKAVDNMLVTNYHKRKWVENGKVNYTMVETSGKIWNHCLFKSINDTNVNSQVNEERNYQKMFGESKNDLSKLFYVKGYIQCLNNQYVQSEDKTWGHGFSFRFTLQSWVDFIAYIEEILSENTIEEADGFGPTLPDLD